MRRLFRLQDDVAAALVDLDVGPLPAEDSRQLLAGEVAREFHAVLSSSSRTRWSRTCSGTGWSK